MSDLPLIEVVSGATASVDTRKLTAGGALVTIPADDVDPEQIAKPRPWHMGQIARFILFVGPCSSVFDYTTYLMMLFLFGCWDVSTAEALKHSSSLFQTGWFVESLLTQTLIIHIIRTNRIPFFQSRASWPLTVTTAIIMALGIWLPSSPCGINCFEQVCIKIQALIFLELTR